MTQHGEGQSGSAHQPSELQDRVRRHASADAEMPVIQPSMGEVDRRQQPASAQGLEPAARPAAPVAGQSSQSNQSKQSSQGSQSNQVRVFGDLTRTGQFRLEEKSSSLMLFGDVFLDLREAELPAESEVTAYSLFGDVKVVVPPGVNVLVSGFSLFGDDKVENSQRAEGGPTLKIHRVGAFSDVKVKTALPGEKISKRWRIL